MLEPEVKSGGSKAKLISMRELPNIVEEAVRAAQVRPNATGGQKIIKRWEIIGRVARDLAEGQAFADKVAANVSARGIKVKSAVLKVDRDIICGFIEPGNIPIDRQF